jgi:hypothetical protein
MSIRHFLLGLLAWLTVTIVYCIAFAMSFAVIVFASPIIGLFKGIPLSWAASTDVFVAGLFGGGVGIFAGTVAYFIDIICRRMHRLQKSQRQRWLPSSPRARAALAPTYIITMVLLLIVPFWFVDTIFFSHEPLSLQKMSDDLSGPCLGAIVFAIVAGIAIWLHPQKCNKP